VQTPLKVGVVVPAHNEEAELANSLGGVPDHLEGVGSLVRIVVDDGSADATAEIARSIKWTVITHPVNQGTGAAVRTGCDAAVDAGCDIVVTMDADGQHRFEDVPRLVTPIIDERVDVVHGARPFDSRMPLLYRVGNITLNAIMLLLFGVRTTDSQCGLRAFRSSAYAELRWHADDYGISSEIWVRLARAKLRHAEIQIPTIYRDKYKGTRPIDGLRILRQMLLWRFKLPATDTWIRSRQPESLVAEAAKDSDQSTG
jgi:glycosyltransferase involved in cell wall biosynthesis